MTVHELTGLDGSNPLAFMAALGAMDVLSNQHPDAPGIYLHWARHDVWTPVLTLPDGIELVETIWRDLEAWRESAPELDLKYEKQTAKSLRFIQDLKPPPEVFRDFATAAAQTAQQSGHRRHADYAAAYAAAHPNGDDPLGVDHGAQTKPTAFHFTAGQQHFVTMVRELCAGLERAHFEEALFGPWQYASALPILRWDVIGERLYALMAGNPSSAGNKAQGTAGADWLAFRSLVYFPTALMNSRIATTGFSGRGNTMTFRWPLWSAPTDANTIRSIVALSHLDKMSLSERGARGITTVLRSEAQRSTQGYGNFAPASVE